VDVGPRCLQISFDQKLYFFVNGGSAMQLRHGRHDADGFGFRVGGGIKYFIVNNIAAVAQLKYTWLSLDPDEGDDMDIDTLDLGVGLSFLF
jgi:opacity protein-like surface antigen